MKVKFCGLCREEDIDAANQVMPDYAGFVFAKSRRRITRQEAERFRVRLRPEIRAVGIFVNAIPEEIIALLMEGIIDLAQLHGKEAAEDLRYIREVSGKPVIKAIQVCSVRDVEKGLRYGADHILFDSGAGTGIPLDWRLLEGVEAPYFLAGGLCTDNIPTVLEKLCPYALDISSGIETDGHKDLCKMRQVMELVRGHNGQTA